MAQISVFTAVNSDINCGFSTTSNSTTVNVYFTFKLLSLLIHIFSEGSTEYTTCSGLLTTSSSTWPQTALFQIAASGVPLSKLVIGKPANSGDASNGFMSTSTLAGCVSQAKNQGWSTCITLEPLFRTHLLSLNHSWRCHGLGGMCFPMLHIIVLIDRP